MYVCIYIYIYICIHIYIYIYIYMRVLSTANLRTKILDFRGFDSSRILIVRGGILMSIGDFPEISMCTCLTCMHACNKVFFSGYLFVTHCNDMLNSILFEDAGTWPFVIIERTASSIGPRSSKLLTSMTCAPPPSCYQLRAPLEHRSSLNNYSMSCFCSERRVITSSHQCAADVRTQRCTLCL